MKKLNTTCVVLTIVLFLSSCGNQKKTADGSAKKPTENQKVESKNNTSNTNTENPEKKVSESETTQVESKVTDTAIMQEGPNKITGELTGTALIENVANRYATKLSLSGDQFNSLKNILTTNFTAMGYNAERVFSTDESKKIGHDLMQKSKTQVEKILTDAQKAEFIKLGHH
jgi:hypothetical protein